MNKAMYSGAQILLKSLMKEGVEEIFGYPGGVVLPLYDALYMQDKIKHYLAHLWNFFHETITKKI